jgi:hypothetical protein
VNPFFYYGSPKRHTARANATSLSRTQRCAAPPRLRLCQAMWMAKAGLAARMRTLFSDAPWDNSGMTLSNHEESRP